MEIIQEQKGQKTFFLNIKEKFGFTIKLENMIRSDCWVWRVSQGNYATQQLIPQHLKSQTTLRKFPPIFPKFMFIYQQKFIILKCYDSNIFSIRQRTNIHKYFSINFIYISSSLVPLSFIRFCIIVKKSFECSEEFGQKLQDIVS